MGDDQRFEADLLKRLDLIISLLLEASPPDSGTTTTDKIVRLIAMGLAPTEVARIVGKPANYVSAVIAKRKARKRRKPASE